MVQSGCKDDNQLHGGQLQEQRILFSLAVPPEYSKTKIKFSKQIKNNTQLCVYDVRAHS